MMSKSAGKKHHMEKNAQEFVKSEQSAKALLAPSGHRHRPRPRPTKQVICEGNQKIVMESSENHNDKDLSVQDLLNISSSLMDKVETDIQLLRENDGHITQAFLQQMKANKRNRNNMRQHVSTSRHFHAYLQKKAQEQAAASKPRDEPKCKLDDVKKQLSALQKQILRDNCKEELDKLWDHVSRSFPLD